MAVVGMTGRSGRRHNPLSCKYGPLSAVRAEGYTQFLGSIRPAKRVERTRTNMSVGHCHEADERSAFRNPAAAHGRGHRNPGRPCERGAGQDGPRRTRAGRDAQGPAAPLRALLPGPSRYQDTPLPIGFDKTISQPFIVALMTDLLGPEPHDSILEVGTGLGYQAAVLAELSGRVWSVEIVEELAGQAEANLRQLGSSPGGSTCFFGFGDTEGIRPLIWPR